MNDHGIQLVWKIFRDMNIDEEWSVETDRGFTWWGHQFAQRIEYFNKFGITQPRLTRAIEQLLAKGFITIIHPGGGHRHDKAIYGLSDKYLTWKPGMVIEKREKESVQRGFCKPNRKL